MPKSRKRKVPIRQKIAEKRKQKGHEVDFDILRPFGPRIARIQMPEEILGKMIELTDEIIKDEERKSWGHHLVGQIKEEPYITKETLQQIGVYDFFNGCLQYYLTEVMKELYAYTEETHLLETAVKDMWSVHMEPGGEYNPLHFHTFCHVSSTGYLKMPVNRPKRNIPHKGDKDGMIEFVDHAAWPESLDRGTMLVEPSVGTMYMWPSHILHTVYPFLGTEERRSVAWNGVYRLTDKKTKDVIAGGNY